MRILFTLVTAVFFAMPHASFAEIGDDGLHKADWFEVTFKDLNEDLADANEQGKRLLYIVEQRGCIYCTKMHEDVYSIPEIEALLEDEFYVVQINMFGDEEITDFDGMVLPEKEMIRRWNIAFTPALVFMPETPPESGNAGEGAVMKMAGAFGKYTTNNLLNYVLEKGYEGEEHFQKYHARKFNAAKAAGKD